MTELPILEATAARTAQTTRRGADITLVVIHDDPRDASAIIADATTRDARRAPHYVIAADGTTTQLVADTRAARHSGLAVLGRRRDIDKISIGVMLASPHNSPAQIQALHALLGLLAVRHAIMAEAALLRWIAPESDSRLGRVEPYLLPPPPTPAAPALLSEAKSVDQIVADPTSAARFWQWLTDLAYRRRGDGFNATQAFALHASKHGLGFPLASGKESGGPFTAGGAGYNAQHFATDTLFNEGQKWTEVQSLKTLLGGRMPAKGTLPYALLEASYTVAVRKSVGVSGTTGLNPAWANQQRAVALGIGPVLGGGGRVQVAGNTFSFQVFAGDTLYTPIANPEAKTNWNDVRRLSELPADALGLALWAETYKLSGATLDAASPLHQAAVAAKIGAPFGAVAQASFEGTLVEYQVFALDIVYRAPGGAVQRASSLPKPAPVANWTPKPATAPTVTAAPPAAAPAPVAAAAPVNISGVTIPGGDRNSPNWPPLPSFRLLPNDAARHAMFGQFSWSPNPQINGGRGITIHGDWQAQNIVQVVIPQLAKLGRPRGTTVQFHRLAAAQLQRLWAMWEQAGLLGLIQTWDGAFVARHITGDPKQLSMHAFGAAFDINAATNAFGIVAPLVGRPGSVRELVPYALACGFYWGGHFPQPRGDGMHFEVAQLMG